MTLDGERHLRSGRATARTAGNVVGVGNPCGHVDVLEAVGAGGHQGRERAGGGAVTGISPGIEKNPCPVCHQRTVSFHAGLEVHCGRMAKRGGRHLLFARQRQLHRDARPLGEGPKAVRKLREYLTVEVTDDPDEVWDLAASVDPGVVPESILAIVTICFAGRREERFFRVVEEAGQLRVGQLS